ncbi:hypothetical protein LG301_16725 [Vreelandella venusta]|uniref:hypothetical protein n=1 Tax=Vreelandella venusta TaxID=44935 RepID=UPI00384DB9F9
MKMQLTALAAAVALTASFSTMVQADPRDWDNPDNDTTSHSPSASTFSAQETIREGMDGFEKHVNHANADANTQYSKVQQSGSYASALVNQHDGPQYSLIQQSGYADEATVLQKNATNNAGGTNESIIKQEGSTHTGNTAIVTQIGYLNDSFVDQRGNNNRAEVDQIDNTASSDSIIHQRGDDNTATIMQTNNTSQTWSFVGQYGNDNVADVTQNYADLSSSFIYQDSRGSQGHYAEVSQTGPSNFSMIRQMGHTQGGAVHSQTGNAGNNTAVTNQW